MQLASNARALLHPRREFLADLMEAVAVERPEKCQKSSHARRAEPGGLVIRRGDGEIERVAGLIPHAAVIAGGDAEAVAAWIEIGIECPPFIDDLLPVAIVAFELVFEMDLLRRDQAKIGVVDLEVASQRGQAQVRRGIVCLAVGGDLLDVHRRREFVEGKVTRIDDADAVPGREPRGFVDGSGWEGVYKALTKDGYTVAIVQNPTITLADDVAVTKRVIAAQNGPVILVGHSYGGAVITEAGNDPKVAGLVYITAFALDKGESVSSLIKDPPPGAPVPPILPPQDGYLFLDKAKFPTAFAGDVSPDTASFMADSQVPWGVEALSGAITEPAWRTKPSWYLVSTEDKMIPPDAQRAMSKRAGSTVVEVKGSHAVYVSQPQAVARLIEQAATGALAAGQERAAAGVLANAK